QWWIGWIRSSWDDVLLAIETGLDDAGEAVIGLEIATVVLALRIQFITGANRAVAGLTERALTVIGDDPAQSRLRVRAKAMVGWISLWQGNIGYTEQLLDECVAECLPDPVLRRHWREHTATDIGLPVQVEFTWGLELFLIHSDPRSIDVLSRARDKFAAVGDRGGTQRSEAFTVLAAATLAEPVQAEQLVRGHLGDGARAAAGFAESWAEVAMLILTIRKGEPGTAVRHGRSEMATHLDNGETWAASWVIHYCASALAAILTRRLESGESPRHLVAAAREIAYLQGGNATLHRSMGIVSERVPLVAAGSQISRRAATAVLGQRRYDEAVQRGAQLSPERYELLHYFQGTLTMPAVGTVEAKDSLWQGLSAAERDIAILVAAGWTNSAVATRRGTSVRTVDAQVASIRRKLDAADRSAVVHRIPEELRDLVRMEGRH
ncbi:MAG: response regulator transcription factor, partial [Stackebrandtia sp.]